MNAITDLARAHQHGMTADDICHGNVKQWSLRITNSQMQKAFRGGIYRRRAH